MNGTRELRFDGWRLRRDSGELIRGDVRVRLQSQPLAVLEALLARPGEVVTRDDLKSSLWPTGVVDFDTALNSAVRRLRRALGDDADTPRYIETLPRRGYRFIGTLDAEPAPAVPDTTGRLPSASEAQPASPLPPAGSPQPANPDAPTFGRPPDPAAVTAVTLPPVAASRRRSAWLGAAAVLSLSAVAALIALQVGSAPEQPAARATAEPGTALPTATRAQPVVRTTADAAAASPLGGARANEDPELADHLSRARLFLQRRSPGDLERARALLEQAIARRPAAAEAHAALASVHWHLVLQELEPQPVGLERMRIAAERALALDPTSTEAHLRLSNYGYATGDRRYRGHFDVATMAAPDSAVALSARAFELQQAGRLDEGVEFARRAALAEPLAAVYRFNLASALYIAGRYDEATRVNREAQELSPGGPADIVAKVLIQQRRYDEALALAASWPDGPARRQVVALAHAAAGRTREADAATRALIESAGERDPLRIAEVYAFRRDGDRAFEWLERGSRAVVHGPARLTARIVPWMLKYSPFVAPIQADPRWEAWAASIGAG